MIFRSQTVPLLRIYFSQQWYGLSGPAAEEALIMILRPSTGSILDATIVLAPSSTRNRNKRRDPQMVATKHPRVASLPPWGIHLERHFGLNPHQRRSAPRSSIRFGYLSANLGIVKPVTGASSKTVVRCFHCLPWRLCGRSGNN